MKGHSLKYTNLMEGGQAKTGEMTKKLDILKEFDYFARMFMLMNEKIYPFSSWKRFCKALELFEAMPARDPPALADRDAG
jgi:hypothetical protein